MTSFFSGLQFAVFSPQSAVRSLQFADCGLWTEDCKTAIKLLSSILLLLAFYSTETMAQCTCNEDDCGPLVAGLKILNDENVVCDGTEFFVQNLTDTPADFYVWDWGDGMVDTTFNTDPISHVYSIPDSLVCLDDKSNYPICLTAYIECGSSFSCNSVQQVISVIHRPKARIEGPGRVCIDDVTILSNLSCNATDYFWEYGNNNSSEDDPVLSFDAPGFYDVTLTASNRCAEDKARRRIEVVGQPVAEVAPTVDPQTFCTNVRITLDNRSQNVDTFTWFFPLDTSAWRFPDTTFTRDSFDNALVFTRPGDFEISLDVTNVCGTDTWEYPFSVFEAPRVQLDEPGTFCENASINFRDYVSYTGSVFGQRWTFTDADGNTRTSDEPFPIVSFTAPGEHEITVAVDGGSCGEAVKSTTLFIQVPGEISLSPPDVPLCTEGDTVSLSAVPPGGDWSGSRAVTADGLFDPAIAGAGIHTLTYTVGEGACTASNTIQLEVLETPSVRLPEREVACDRLSFTPNADIRGDYSAVRWTYRLADGATETFTQESPPTVAFETPGRHLFWVEVEGECGTFSDTTEIEIQSLDPIVIEAPQEIICSASAPDTIAATPAGGVWSGPGISREGVFNPAVAGKGAHVLTYTVGEGACNASGSVTVEVLEAPSASLPERQVACDQLSFKPEAVISGDFSEARWTYLLEDGTTETFLQEDPPTVNFNVPGRHLFWVEVDSDCGLVTDTTEIEIQSIDPIVIETPSGPLCNTSDPDTIRATPAGGVWSGIGISRDGVFDPAQVPGGTTAVWTYTVGQGVCQSEGRTQLEFLEAPPVTIDPGAVLCVDNRSYQLEFSPEGGIWSGNGVVDATAGVFDPGAAGTGVHELIYSFTDVSGCKVVKTTKMTVEELPVFNVLEENLTFCETTENISLQDKITITSIPSGGDITWSGPGIVSAAGTFNSFQAGAAGEGSYTVYISYQRNDCAVGDSLQIVVTAVEEAYAGEDTTVCISDGTLTLAGTPEGGRWTGPGINPATGRIDLEAAGGGVLDYRYIFAEGTTCQVEDEVQVEIIDLRGVNAGFDVDLCEGAAIFDLTGFSPAGGIWSGAGIVDPTAGRIDPGMLRPDSIYLLTYCLEAPQADCSACDQIRVKVNPLPVAGFTILGTTCVNEVIELENLSADACSYRWDFGDGNTSTAPAPRHTYSQPGTYTISLTAFSCADCEDVYSTQVVVTTPPTASFEMDKQEGCAVLDVTFENRSFGADIIHFWDFGNGDTSALQDPGEISFDQTFSDTTYQIELAVTNACGTVYHRDSVTVFPRPVVRLGTDVDDGCSPLEISLANPTLGDPETFFWDFGNGETSTDSLPDIKPVYTTSDTAVSVYTITLIAQNRCGRDTMTKDIVVYPPNVEAFLSVDTTRGCQPLTVTFESFSTPGARISWDFGDGNGLVTENAVHTFETPGFFTVRQFASNCGTDSDSVTIEVLPAPEVRFSHEPFICQGKPLQLNNESVNITGSVWRFGDGDTSLLQSPEHIYDSAGVFPVTLTGFSSLNQCPATYTSEVEVFGNPDVGFTPSVSAGCVPLSVSFETAGIGATAYEWDFGDGAFGNGPSGRHTFETAGVYRVRLKASDDFGCFSDSATVDIIARPPPVARFETDREAYCSRIDSVRFINRTTGAAQYTWSFADGSGSTLFEPAIFLQDTGRVGVMLIAETAFGCRDTASAQVTLLGTPVAAFEPEVIEGCAPLTADFSNRSRFADQYVWDFDDGNISGRPAPLNTFAQDGLYEVTLVAGSSNGCPSDTARAVVRVNPVPQSAFTISDDLVCGLPHTIATANTSSGAVDYLWAFGNGVSSTEASPGIRYDLPGEFRISLVATNAFGCRDTSFRQVSMNRQPVADFDPMNYTGCETDTIQFRSFSANADSWLWDFGDGNTADVENPVHRYAGEGNYEVRLIAGFNGSCFDTLTVPNTVSLISSPEAAFTWVDQTDGFVQFLNESTGGFTFNWDFGDGATSDQISPRHEYDRNGEWNVRLTVTAANGCRDVATGLIAPEIFFGLYMPNAMSPESGVGDVRLFKPTGLGIRDYLVQVFSPWGQLVWETDVLDGEQPGASWDGTYNGKIVPQGAYVWKANVTFINGVKQTKTGTVTVIR